ncbi:hypothetical protein GO986_05580 [Deinococcus sp. HMF7620]|uniref:Bacterial transcriptional activator domain-containing protein n=1 Tax=Deinococcus arboris TaxID=2682977 RepID=A0A7C9I239_9DEIO|nr:BTAD domain-containing putative transcriptional regulator [Deinococcus arboris]MVN86231.1 hypothetical protein [Deinococcus arboris]
MAHLQLSPVIPRPLRGELPRASVAATLAEAETPLVVLVAPSGYGKTTALAQHARQTARAVAWLTVQEDHAESGALEQAVVAALKAALPEVQVPQWQAAQLSPAPAARAQALARDLDGAPANLDLVLDGADLLGTAAGRWLDVLVGALGEGHRLLLSGCERPPLQLSRHLAAGTARLLGAEDLAFSLPETQTYFAGRQAAQSPEAAHQALEGWPAGLALVASGAAPLLLPDDLLRDVLGRLPPEVRVRLPEAAVADTWHEAGLARLGVALPTGWLRVARAVGLPLTPLGGEAARPHRLVLNLLEAELRAQPERHQQLHLAAGQAAEADGEEVRALGHYLKAGAQDTALALAERLVRRYEVRWEPRLVRQVVEQLPEVHLTPQLRRAWGQALLETGEAARGEALLRTLRAEGHRDRRLLFALGTLAARSGRFQEQLALADEGLALTQPDEPTLSLRRLRASALLGCGELAAGLQEALAAAEQAEAEDDLLGLGAALALVHEAYMVLGQPLDSERALRRGLEVYQALGMPSRALALQNDLACLLQGQGRIDEGLTVGTQALTLATQEGSIMQPLLQATLGDLHRAAGEYEQARALYGAALAGSAAFKLDTLPPLIWPGLAEAALRCGDLPAANEALTRARHAAPHGASESAHQLALCEGLFAFEQRDWAAAQTYFAQAAQSRAAFGVQERAQAYLAELARQVGRVQAAHLAPLRLALQHPERSVLRADAAVLTELFALCQGAGEVTTGHPAYPAAPGVPCLRLDLLTLGSLRVQVQSEPLHLPRAKSGEILVWLALHGPGTRERIVDALWDGSAERRHGEHFRVAVRQLRCALAAHPAVTFNPLPFEAGLYRLAEEFEVCLDSRLARAALASGEPEALRRAAEAYAGPFLPQQDAEWIAELRGEVEAETLAAALTLGAQTQATDSALSLWAYTRAADLDPMNEQAQRGLLRGHLRLGDQGAADRAYARYARRLLDELNEAPGFTLRDL